MAKGPKPLQRDDAQIVALVALYGSVPRAAEVLRITRAALYQYIASRPALSAHVACVRTHGNARRGACRADGCEKPVKSSGLCNAHYKRWRKHGDSTKLLKKHTRHAPGQRCSHCDRRAVVGGLCKAHYYEWWKAHRPRCSVDGCERLANSLGFCPRHYQRLRKFGHPTAGPAFRRDRGTGLPRWVYGQKRSADKAQATPELAEYCEILRRDPCSYCGGQCEHIDHIDPFTAGGRLTVENVTAACAACNHRKHSTSLLLFLADNPIQRKGVMQPYGEGQLG